MDETVKTILANHSLATRLISYVLFFSFLLPESSLFGGKSGADVFKVC